MTQSNPLTLTREDIIKELRALEAEFARRITPDVWLAGLPVGVPLTEAQRVQRARGIYRIAQPDSRTGESSPER